MPRGGKTPKAKKEEVEPPPPPKQPIKVSNLYDAGMLKGTLDDVAREVVLDAGYEEDVMVSNIKIGLGLGAIAAALYSQFGPGKFPANWWQVFACVVTYIVLTLALNIYSWQVEGDAFLLTKPFKGSSGLHVASRMERFSDSYTLLLSDRANPQIEVTGTFTIPKFFHSDGYLAEEAWRAEVERLRQAFGAAVEERKAKKDN